MNFFVSLIKHINVVASQRFLELAPLCSCAEDIVTAVRTAVRLFMLVSRLPHVVTVIIAAVDEVCISVSSFMAFPAP